MKLYNILNPEFGEVFSKLMVCKTVKGNVAFRLAELAQKIKEKGDLYDKLRLEACEEFAEKDVNGKPIMDNKYKINISKEEMKELSEQFLDEKSYSQELEKYYEKDADGKPVIESSNYRILPDKMAELNMKVQDMLNVDIEFEKFTRQDIENAGLSANEILVIIELFK